VEKNIIQKVLDLLIERENKECFRVSRITVAVRGSDLFLRILKVSATLFRCDL
jgi:hypothetical protein